MHSNFLVQISSPIYIFHHIVSEFVCFDSYMYELNSVSFSAMVTSAKQSQQNKSPVFLSPLAWLLHFPVSSIKKRLEGS